MKKKRGKIDNKIRELDENSLSDVAGGFNKHVNFKNLSEEQADDYAKHGSTVLYFESSGVKVLDNGQIVNIARPGFYVAYYDDGI